MRVDQNNIIVISLHFQEFFLSPSFLFFFCLSFSLFHSFSPILSLPFFPLLIFFSVFVSFIISHYVFSLSLLLSSSLFSFSLLSFHLSLYLFIFHHNPCHLCLFCTNDRLTGRLSQRYKDPKIFKKKFFFSLPQLNDGTSNFS